MNKKIFAAVVALLVILGGAFYLFIYKQSNSGQVGKNKEDKAENALSGSSSRKIMGIIYERDSRVQKNKKPSREFALFTISNGQLSEINTGEALAWTGINGTPVILYTKREVIGQRNVFDVSAYDLTSLSEKQIRIPSEANAYSVIAYSPTEKKVAYCAEDETVFNILDLATGGKDVFPTFSGCTVNNSFAPPEFAPDGKEIYYQTFGSNEDGSYDQSRYKYQKLLLSNGKSIETPIETSPTNLRFDPQRKWFATMETVANDVDSYSNQLAIFDIAKIPAKDIPNAIHKQTAPIIAREPFGAYVHIGDIQRTDDSSGFFFYTMTQKGRRAEGGDFRIGFFDNATKKLTYPIGNIPTGYSSVTLLGSIEDIVAFRMQNTTTGLGDVYYASVSANTINLVERSVGLSVPGKVYFVESK